MHPSGLDISSPRHPTKDVVDKTCPNPSDIKVAREFLFSLDPYCRPMAGDSVVGLREVADWLQVNFCIICRRN